MLMACLLGRALGAGLDPRRDDRAELLLRPGRRLAVRARVPAPATSSSCALCSTICASVLPPLRVGSFICSQICARRLARPTPSRRARGATSARRARARARGCGPDGSVVHSMPTTPSSVGAAHDRRIVQRPSACPGAGASPAGWQLTQRGWVNTRAASRNSARERSARSPMTLKSATLRSSVGGTSRSGPCVFGGDVTCCPLPHAATARQSQSLMPRSMSGARRSRQPTLRGITYASLNARDRARSRDSRTTNRRTSWSRG